MKRALLGIAAVGLLAGCGSWGRNVQHPPQRTLEDQVEARRKEDAKIKKCVLEQQVRRQQKEQGRSVKPFPKETC
ncbi:hypothetical protein [Caulobacter sp. 1776]|uniref:hypothetical protein n=1 Tax=Caulobacter sp. 1776 TaxID=3156420 RepID=UPI00339AF90A